MSLFNTIRTDMIAHVNKHGYRKGVSFKLVLLSLISPEFRLILNFRLSSYFFSTRLKILGYFLYQRGKLKYSSDIHPSAKIGDYFKLGHHMNIVIGPDVEIGNNCQLFNGVTLGNKNVGGQNLMPVIHDNVIIGTGAKILGDVCIANDCVIGANSVVLSSFSKNSIIAGIPAKKIKVANETKKDC